ncbi:hypothetical protein J6590_027064 [Homalodisca vitripennis]|nr:hypothetical protein J6590_027064 [Homalodisca vitripennis]
MDPMPYNATFPTFMCHSAKFQVPSWLCDFVAFQAPGLHLNTKGKRWIAGLLAKKIVELTTKKTTTEEALNLSISGDQPPPPGTEPSSGNDLNTLEATDP